MNPIHWICIVCAIAYGLTAVVNYIAAAFIPGHVCAAVALLAVIAYNSEPIK